VACGYYHTLILSATRNDVLACGLNRNGQPGIGPLGTQTTKNKRPKKRPKKKTYATHTRS
jgi:alpha-tubulin suppressor-like RCC1 family protein